MCGEEGEAAIKLKYQMLKHHDINRYTVNRPQGNEP